MSKITISSYVFDPVAKTIRFPGFPLMATQGSLLLVTNATRQKDLYIFNDTDLSGSISGNILTLSADTTGMAAEDDLIIYYDDGRTAENVSTTQKRFRDGFTDSDGIDTSIWSMVNADNHLITVGGDANGSSYARISLDPFKEATEVSLTSKELFNMPMRVGFGVSISQRIVGQEVFVGLVGDNDAGNIDVVPTDNRWNSGNDMALPGSITVTVANVIPISIPNHGLKGNDRIALYGNTDSRLNVGPVVVTVIDANNITVPAGTLATATYQAGGFIRYSDGLRNALNGIGYLFESATATQASQVSRNNTPRARLVPAVTHSTTTASQSNTSPYTDAFKSGSNFELQVNPEETSFRSFTADSVATTSGYGKFTQDLPDGQLNYHIHIRARTLTGFTKPVARITSIQKTGTTTATVTTDAPHGLNVNSFVQIYGVRDQTNFPNLTAQTQVASVINATQFTIIIGSASTNSSVDGAVYLVQGGTLAPGAFSQVAQSISVSNNILFLTGNAAWATPLPGEFVYIYGLTSSLAAYEGAYKVMRVNSTVLELVRADSSSLTNLGSTNTGGVLIRMTDIRLHFARVLDHSRLEAEIVGGRGNTSDANNSVPVAIAASATVPVSQGPGSTTSLWHAGQQAALSVADIASAAITSTSTSSAITPGTIANIGSNSQQYSVSVTALSGTNPTMDVVVQESPDAGGSWIDVYHFERITATGLYTSPVLPTKLGNQIRYVRTPGGTTPSITNSLRRNMHGVQSPFWRRFFDRSISTANLNVLNSAGAVFNVQGAKDFAFFVKMAAIGSGLVLKVQGRNDGTTTGWFDIPGLTLTPTVINTVYGVFVKDIPVDQVRIVVGTAGTGTNTLDYMEIKATGL